MKSHCDFNPKKTVIQPISVKNWPRFWGEVDINGQFISKANCQVVNSFKKRMNEFIFTTTLESVINIAP